MCTVSFVPTAAGVVLTSNRDEHVLRSAQFPKTYLLNNKPITYPKDPHAGGTWFAVSTQPVRVYVLLNGAETNHQRANTYRKSRGLVVLDLISAAAAVHLNWPLYDLQDIEPFTLVVFENKLLYQLRWDGNFKSMIQLDVSRPYIWSSSTLYTEAIRAQRQGWFADFLSQNPSLSAADMLRFHSTSQAADGSSRIVMERSPDLKTISITQAIVAAENMVLQHEDLLLRQSETYVLDAVYS